MLALLLCLHTVSMAQTPVNSPDSIQMKEVFGGSAFYHSGKKISMKKAQRLMVANPYAHQQMKKARNINGIATGIAFAGGYLIGYPVGMAIGGKQDPVWTLAGIGAGLIAVAIPVAIHSNKFSRNAVAAHNEQLGALSSHRSRELHVQLSATGLGIALSL